MCVYGNSGSQRRTSDSLILLSQMIVSCLAGAVIQTCSTEKLVNAHKYRALSFFIRIPEFLIFSFLLIVY